MFLNIAHYQSCSMTPFCLTKLPPGLRIQVSESGSSWPSCFFFFQFLCPQRNFGRHIVIALSVRQSVRPSRFRVRSISPIFFEVGIPNLVCGYILGWRSVAYFFRVTVTLTSDLVFRIIVSGAYLLYYLN